jgi:ribose transport system permease protein
MRYKLSTKAVRRLISIGLVVVLALVFTFTTTDFFNQRNIILLLKDSAFVGLIALGVAFVMIGGGIDLSGGGIVCVVSILSVRLSFLGLHGILILVIGVIIGAACGIVNSFFITKVGLTEFVATLATGFVFAGMGLLFAFRSDGHLSGNLISKSISNYTMLQLGGTTGGIYNITIIWIVLTIIGFLVLTKTTFGLHTFALGSNPKSSAMSGMNTARQKSICFIISGACAGLAGVMVTSNIGAANASLGPGYEFQAIAACVVGGIVLGGGKGDTIGAFLGSIFLIMILNGLYKFGIPTYWQYVLQGGIIIVATLFDVQFSKLTSKHRLTGKRRLAAS